MVYQRLHQRGIIARKYGTIVRDAFNRRTDGDYGVMVTFTPEDVSRSFENMKDFIATIEDFIHKQPMPENQENDSK